MRDIIKKVPIPTAGVALGLAALGNLLQPYAEIAHIACGALSLFLVAMLVAKLIMFPSMLREDMKNSVFASVFCHVLHDADAAGRILGSRGLSCRLSG